MRQVTRRAIQLITLLALTAAGVFVLLSFSPVDPVKAYLGSDLMRVDPSQYPLIKARWGLDQPLWMRLWQWFKNLCSGDMGYSLLYNMPVIDVIRERAGPSLLLIGSAWLLSGIGGVLAGITAGLYLNRWPDKIIRTASYIASSLPMFWVGLILLSFFSVTLGWTPICCAWSIGETAQTAGWADRLYHLILPACTIGLLAMGTVALHTRERVAQVMKSDFVLFAKSQGEHGAPLMRFHVLRHAVTPAIALQFAALGDFLGGSILAEKVFAYPGLGQATVDAGLKGDIPLLMGIVLISTVLIYVGNTAADLIIGHLERGLKKDHS